MPADFIDHATLVRLVEAGAVRAAHVVARAEGWGIIIAYGDAEHPLAATRSRKMRVFRKLDTLVAYLHELGIHRFDVDAAEHNAGAGKAGSRPDRAEALKRMHEAAEYDAWFRREVEEALSKADDPGTVWLPHEAVMADMRAHIDRIVAQKGKSRAD